MAQYRLMAKKKSLIDCVSLLEKKTNQITLDVTNQAKVPLPETGGSGRLGIYLLAFISIAIAGIYLYLQRLERRGGGVADEKHALGLVYAFF